MASRNIHVEILKEEETASGVIFDVQVVALEGKASLEGEKITLYHNGEALGTFPLDRDNRYVHRRIEVPKGAHSFQASDEMHNFSALVRPEADTPPKQEKGEVKKGAPSRLRVAVMRLTENEYVLVAAVSAKDGNGMVGIPIRLLDREIEGGFSEQASDEFGRARFTVSVTTKRKDVTIVLPGYDVPPWKTGLFVFNEEAETEEGASSSEN